MRVVLFLFIVAVVALLIAFGTGFMTITQTRTAEVPDVSIDRTGVDASGGRTPIFDIETGSVAVGTKTTNVEVPTVNVVPPDEPDEAARNAGQPSE